MRVERVDTFHVAVISEAGEALTIPNAEFLLMMKTIYAGAWDALMKEARAATKQKRSAARIRT